MGRLEEAWHPLSGTQGWSWETRESTGARLYTNLSSWGHWLPLSKGGCGM